MNNIDWQPMSECPKSPDWFLGLRLGPGYVWSPEVFFWNDQMQQFGNVALSDDGWRWSETSAVWWTRISSEGFPPPPEGHRR